MSAVMSHTDDLEPEEPSGLPPDEPVPGSAAVVVKRNAGLAALIGAAASAISIAYLWRAVGSAAPLDWALCAVMAAIGTTYLVHLVDARTPLLVADDLGVRIRLGHQWRGLPWEAVDRVAVRPRRGLLRDGRLMFAPHSLARALDGLDARGRRAAALNQKLYGAALAVPLGLTTRVSAGDDVLVDDLAALAQGRSEVLVVEPERAPRPDHDAEPPPHAEVQTTETEATESVESTESTESTESVEVEPEGDAEAEIEVEAEVHEPAASPLFTFEPSWKGEDAEHAEDDLLESDFAHLADPADTAADPEESPELAEQQPERGPRRSLLGGLGTWVSRVARGRHHDVDAEPVTDAWDAEQPDRGLARAAGAAG